MLFLFYFQDTSSNNSQGSSSSSSRYIPPHLRKGFSGKPDICPDPAITKYKKIDGPTYTLPETLPENASPQKMVESELNWQKWKLERSIKKVLNNLSVENVIGLSVDISKACEASQLSKKFPGTSEVNVLADLLVARIIDQKDSFEIVVPLCCLLNGKCCRTVIWCRVDRFTGQLTVETWCLIQGTILYRMLRND